MAQIEQSDGGKKKKGGQKKMQIHVDFTPMVDMNMLLITFFMLCTTMIKSQTLNIALPAPPKDQSEINQDPGDTAADSRSLTIFVDAEKNADGTVKLDDSGRPVTTLYYFSGTANITSDKGRLVKVTDKDDKEISNPLKASSYTIDSNEGIRFILRDKNKGVIKELDDLKKKWRSGLITDEEFDVRRQEVINNKDLEPAQITLKATDEASWEAFVASLDEMNINGINQFRVSVFSDDDKALLDDYKAANGKR